MMSGWLQSTEDNELAGRGTARPVSSLSQLHNFYFALDAKFLIVFFDIANVSTSSFCGQKVQVAELIVTAGTLADLQLN